MAGPCTVPHQGVKRIQCAQLLSLFADDVAAGVVMDDRAPAALGRRTFRPATDWWRWGPGPAAGRHGGEVYACDRRELFLGHPDPVLSGFDVELRVEAHEICAEEPREERIGLGTR